MDFSVSTQIKVIRQRHLRNRAQLDIPDIPAPRGLKRRATGRAAQSQVNGSLQSMPRTSMQASIQEEEEEEPRHKKFKALFEGTQGPLQSAEILDDSVPATVSRKETGGTIPSFVSDPLASATGSASITKRKVNEALDNGDERAEPANVANSSELTGKRRRMDGSASNKPGSLLKNQVMVEPSQGTETPAGSNPEFQSSFTSDDSQSRRALEATRGRDPEGDPGAKTKNSRRVKIESPNKDGSQIIVEPDQDRHFLQALASRTKTRSKEDDFDREFNQLRIAVPDKNKAENDRLRKEMAVWNELEHDPNVRGNFMVVEYCDVFRPTGSSRAKAFNEAWTGQPNFKKFKKVCPLA